MSTSEIRSTVLLSTSQAWALARDSVVGRLAVVVADHPDIFPVNHVVDHGTIVFRTAEGTKLSSAIGKLVAFELDGYDVDSASAWSVVIKGRAHEILELDEVLDALSLPVFPWHHAPKPRYVRIEADTISGMRFPVTGGTHATPPAGATLPSGSDESS
jgi:nitroimidazol reductase NimA-like FMN-containing flavoprotein (pyridoxamine 5'-phosphate oxidase superfamily)